MTRLRLFYSALFMCAGLLLLPGRASALELLCDPANTDCRAPLLNLINNESVEIDVAFWFMEDDYYRQAIIAAKNRGVKVRILFDSEALPGFPVRQFIIDQFAAAGIPIRDKTDSGILHWKVMLFAGQNTVQFSGANYSGEAFVYTTKYSNYVDEEIYFTDKPSIVNSFKTKYDDVWTLDSGYVWWANAVPLQRSYPTFPIDPQMNFPPPAAGVNCWVIPIPRDCFRDRSVAAYNAETAGVDAIMYRITDRSHTDALIAAVQRGVRVRLITEPLQYRDESRLWDSWNVDRMYVAGLQYPINGQPGFQIRFRAHAGLSHEKLTLLVGQGLSIFGSSNWTSPSSDYQREANIFTTDLSFYLASRDHFDRKWNNTGPAVETQPFAPLPPDAPALSLPGSGSTGQPQSVTLTWSGGPWAHRYDVYFGTSPSFTATNRIITDQELGPYDHTLPVSNLAGGTTYYWKVVGRTMANLEASSQTWSFTTAGGGGGGGGGGALPSGWSHQDVGAVGVAGSATYDSTSSTFTVSGSGADIWGNADAFHYAFKTLSGDGQIVARVATVSNTDNWTKAGVMIRGTLSADSAQASMFVTPGKGLAFQRRTTAGGSSTNTSGGSGTAPYWVKLTRSGSTITASVSTNGSSWTTVGSDTISLSSTAYIGLVVSAHNNATIATATFTNVTVTSGGGGGTNTPPNVNMTSPSNGATYTAPASVTVSANASDIDGTIAKVDFFAGTTLIGTDTTSPYSIAWNNVAAGTYTLTARATDNGGATTTSAGVTITVNTASSGLPSGWSHADIGSTGATGNATYNSGTFTVTGAGADIWGTADAFQFAYRTMSGDGSIVARVASVDYVHAWTKVGVMIRASLTPGSRHAMMIVSAGKGLAFQRRLVDGGDSTHTAGPAATAPYWVKLQRTGNTITAYASTNGTTWTLVGSDTISLPTTVYVGLPVTSHTYGVLATGVVDSVTVGP